MINLLSKTSRIIRRPFWKLSISPKFFFSISNNLDFEQLTSAFLKQPDMTVFSQLVRASNNTVDYINYFKIFKFLEDTKSDVVHYQDFFLMIFSTVTKRSDNLRMLLAKIKARIAKKHEEKSQLQQALSHLEQGLEVLEQSLVPPIMLYYQMYRYFGLIHYKLNRLKQAQQILQQSVTTIQQCIQHSDDFVSTNDNSKLQAKALTVLAQIDSQSEEQWINKASKSWGEVETDKFLLMDYCQYILTKAKIMMKKDKEKGEEFLTVSIYQMKIPALKQYLKDKKKQLMK